jgi:Ni/Co efflux regulator RcnB
MKKNRILAALLCASMGLAATASFAQPAPQGPGPDQYHGQPGGPGYHGGPDHGPEMNPHDAHYDQHGHNAPRPPEHADNGPYHQDWRKGERLSNDYRDRQYVVDNWHEHGLHQPPRGYHWVGVGGDYLLVAAASGIIAQIVLSH